ncbi:MAG: AI-2E family transporter [Acidobacteria bacterium]|nr:AI-2E family transporter [Acidobacteriota bacterium]
MRRGAGTQLLVAAAAFVVVVAGLQAAASLIQPFLIAVFLGVVNVPFMNWLQRLRVPRPLAVLATILFAAALVAILVTVVGQSVNQLARVVPSYRAPFLALAGDIQNLAEQAGLPAVDLQSMVIPSFNLAGTLAGNALRAVGALLSNAFLVLLLVIFILFEAAGFNAKLAAAFGDEGEHLRHLARMAAQVQQYLVIKTAVSTATGLFIGVWVWMVGLDAPQLWGVLAFAFNFIPTLGSIFAAVPAILLALIQPEVSPVGAAVIAGGYVGVNVVFGNFVEPTLMGRRLGLSTLVVFVSLVFWGWVWGPVGMLFSVPLTMVVKIALENTTEFRWVAVMLDANPTGYGRKA